MYNDSMPQHKEMTSSHVERLAQQALEDLDVALSRPHLSSIDIVVDGSQQPVRIPRSVASALREVLANSAEGRPVEVVPVRKELTTQQAADILHVSRPHVVKLIDTGVLARPQSRSTPALICRRRLRVQTQEGRSAARHPRLNDPTANKPKKFQIQRPGPIHQVHCLL